MGPLLVVLLASLASAAALGGSDIPGTGGAHWMAPAAAAAAAAPSRLHPAFRDGAALRDLILRLPKAELHLHIEGTLEVDMMFELAAKNGVELPYADADAARAARENFKNLDDFLAMYSAAARVLKTEDDFYQLATAYLKRAHVENVTHAEIFFDPLGHLARGVPLGTVVRGLTRAIAASPVSASLVLCVQREYTSAAGAAALALAAPYLAPRGAVIGVGLDGPELGNPPANYRGVFAAAGKLGLHRVAHAGEEGGPAYVAQALALLRAERIDHGIRALEDPTLAAAMAAAAVPITLCPLSNLRLRVYDGQLEARVRAVLASGLAVTLNSDDPAYFGAYVAGNYEWVAGVAGLGPEALAGLAAASFKASFITQNRKDAYIASVEQALADWQRDQPAPTYLKSE
ncbi:MAG: adenosine deaminase [Monoraphidium minutum]|nr:MAG: adenosine deaminase [Monoraphidium minutum]